MMIMDFDSSQQQVLSAVAEDGHGPLLVYGGPGSGKTTVAVELALRHLRAGHDSRRLLMLSPTRSTSARLRDELEGRWAVQRPGASMSEVPSRSFASYAFWLLGEARRRDILTFRARRPRLLSGAEQDSIIRELLNPDPPTGTDAVAWPKALLDAARTEGFRKEIRELFDRAAEYGVSPEQLRRFGQDCGRPEWVSAGELYRRYREDLDAGSNADAFDPAGLINEACNLLEENEELLQAERARLTRVVVDDLQEASPTVHRLLRLIGAGRDVVAFATPETAVQGFRGARPDKLRGWTVPPPTYAVGDADVSAADPETDLHVDGIIRRSVSGAMTPDQYGGLPGAEPWTTVLTGNHRLSPEVGKVYARTLRRIAPVGPHHARDRWSELLREPSGESAGATGPAAPPEAPGSVAVEVVPSDYMAEQFILQEVLDRHHRQGIPLREVVVIARNGAMVQRVVRMLQAQGVPVRQSMSDVILKQEPAVVPLLNVLQVVTSRAERVELPEILSLLASRYGETDSMTLRSLRQVMRQAERRRCALGEEPRSSDELLIAAVNDPQDAAVQQVLQDGRYRHLTKGLQRAAAMVAAGEAAFEEASGPEELLWEIWDAAGVSHHWAALTRRPSVEGRRADRDLDAVMALFQTAERFADQNPGKPALSFVDYMERLELPMDTLAQIALAEDAVEVLTPASAAGREFDTVILSGLQEGAWPNLQPRGQLLGSAHLVDVVEGRTGAETQSALAKRIQVLQDEYRLFASAVSRARDRLFSVAVHAQEESPSMLLDLVVPPSERQSRNSAIPRPITAPRLVAELRRHLERSIQQELEDETHSGADKALDVQRGAAARALALLAEGGLTGADPDTWWGLPQLSTSDPLLSQEEEVRVSPSSVQTAVESPLQWFTGAAGGVEATDFSRMLGSLIHEIAEHHPEETRLERLTEELDARWEALRREEGWETEKDRRRAAAMLEKLVAYFHEAAHAGRRVVARELQVQAPLEVPIAVADGSTDERTVTIRGVIDRVERTAAGGLFVVDLKTGRRKPAKDEIPTHGQLGSYQLLVSLGAVDRALQANSASAQNAGDPEETAADASPVSGAALLHVGTAVVKTDLQEQDPLGNERWPYQQLALVAEVMSGSTFEAFHSPNQQRCLVGPLCPLCVDTKQVTQP